MVQQPNAALDRRIFEVSRSHTDTNIRQEESSARREGRHILNTQQTQETSFHALSVIR